MAAAAVIGVAITAVQAIGMPAASVTADQAIAAATPPRGEAAAKRKKAGRRAPADRADRAARTVKGQVKADDVLKLARSQLGQTEDGQGNSKFGKWYSSTKRAKQTVRRDGGSVGAYDAAAWCSMFISWIGDRLGFDDQLGMDAWTVSHARWFKDQNRWGTKPKKGAVVFFDWGRSGSLDGIDHVGLVIQDNGDGTIKTIEGNASNAVRIKTRPTGAVVGYGYPDYVG